uniref:Receptor-like serine/threonine-protein kinase n=1 Tax=Oryza barthii TaxID=65489 RepID=A0A0D3EUV2_9ORYZ
MASFSSLCCYLLLFVVVVVLTGSCRARDTVVPGRPLAANETLVSGGDANFVLGFFTPPGANSTYVGVWYNKVSVRTVVWVANREDPLPGDVADNPDATLSVSPTGTLAIVAGNSTVVWSVTPAAKLASPTARIMDSGNLVIADGSGGAVAWQGFDYPTDTLLPEMRLGVDYVKGRNRTLTAWKSPSDPSPGSVVMAMDTSGDPQVFIWNGAEKVWRSGPWDGVQFTGVPDTVTYSGSTFSFINNAKEVTYSFQVHNVSIISRLGLNSTVNYGLLQRSTWVEAAGTWNLYWYAPKDQCDEVSPCGANGMCDTNNLPVCSCLRGFTPKSPEAWALRDGRAGCVRSTPLDCQNGTDGFVAVKHAKVPDTERSVVDLGLSLEQCRKACLMNCSCTAYASANVSGGVRGHGAGTGCVMWTTGLTDLRVYPEFGQDLFVRLAAADLGLTSKSNNARVIIAIVVSISSATFFRYVWLINRGLDEFKNEVMLIAKLQHRNLVRLLGFSISGQERILVYEYMANKSLDYFLFEKSNSVLLDWQARYRIIEGITRGLLYLHQDSRYRIIHRDLKASNVLLDKEMTPKISDFGMARMFGSEETEINTRKVVGTYGYMSPEYAMDGVFSVKSDVFSFGVLLLEIISGRRNRGVYSYSNHLNLLGHAWSLWNEGKSLELADETMNGSFDSDEVLKCIRVGLLCVQENPDDRPLMSQVLLMLATTDATTLPTPKQPGFAARRILMETDTSSSKPDCSIFDTATVTILEGR